jgi:hypothetical protein
MKSVFLLAFASLLSIVFAHYTLDYPPTTGFDEDLEPNAPCGNYDPEANNLTAFPLSGGEIAIDSHHPTMTLLFRAQLMGSNTWVNLTDGFLVMTGLGELCLNALPVPSNWTGKAAVIQTIGQPPDGILYQVPNSVKSWLNVSVRELTSRSEHLERVHFA